MLLFIVFADALLGLIGLAGLLSGIFALLWLGLVAWEAYYPG